MGSPCLGLCFYQLVEAKVNLISRTSNLLGHYLKYLKEVIPTWEGYIFISASLINITLFLSFLIS